MAREVLNNLQSFGIQRAKINANFLELYTIKLESGDVLTKTNTTPYTPTDPYNPATRVYADSISTNLIAVYDPTSVNADAFDRNNHHNNMAAVYVTQDTDHRFASDVEKTSWNNKEDAIGAKGTAFNKDFGTIATTVSEGDHTHTGVYEPQNANIQSHISTVTGNPHVVTLADLGAEPANANIQSHIATVTGNPHNVTKSDVALPNVDNTSDANKEVSGPQQTALDLKQTIGDPIAQANFDTAALVPLYREATIFWDDSHKAISGYNDINGMVINYGFEFLIRVKNDSGFPILDGSACRFDGVDVATFHDKIVLAQADTYNNARVEGIATHDIPNGTLGYITRSGAVHGIDTNTFPPGSTVYLSPTVPGGYTVTLPTIRTALGTIRRSDVDDGVLLVLIDSNIALPAVFGQLSGMTDTYTLTTSYQNIDNYDNEDSVVCPVDGTLGYISPEYTGKYRYTLATKMSFTSISSARSIDLQLYDVTAAAVVDGSQTNIYVGRDAESVSRSISPPINVTLNHEYVVQVRSDDTFSTVTVDNISFDIQSIHIG